MSAEGRSSKTMRRTGEATVVDARRESGDARSQSGRRRDSLKARAPAEPKQDSLLKPPHSMSSAERTTQRRM
jgi:hypothetical protein